MSDQIKPPRKRPGCLAMCGGTCLGGILLFCIIFSVAYNMTGVRRPNIPPPKPLPSPNAFDDYIAAGQAIVATGGTRSLYPAGTRSRNISLPAAKAVVSANRQALQQVRNAFPKECRAPSGRNISGASLNYMSDLREIARLLSAEALVRKAAGDYAGAFAAGLDAVELGTDVARGGFLMNALLAVSIQAIGHVSMLENLEQLPLNGIQPLVRRLERMVLSEVPVREIIEEERNIGLTQLLEIDDIRSVAGPQSTNTTAFWEKAFGGMAWHFMRDQTIREVEEYYDAALPQLKKPTSARKMPPEPQGALSGIMIPVINETIPRLETQSARNRILLCALALRGYRLQHGRYPKELGQLGLKVKSLQDPFTGRSLIYRNLDEDYFLYSVGPDGRDDGAIPADEGDQPLNGDIGIRAFIGYRQGSPTSRYYRRVPHMKPPSPPPGAPPLNP